ncbi:MAG: hypothetical protein ABI240_10815 [Sphingomonas sp.]
MFAAGKIKPKFIDHGPLDVTTYSNTAVVTGVDHLGATAGVTARCTSGSLTFW